jgi:hypothetical protein
VIMFPDHAWSLALIGAANSNKELKNLDHYRVREEVQQAQRGLNYGITLHHQQVLIYSGQR